MSVENEFLVYGIEEYKAAHAMTGAAVAALFSKFGVFDYVRCHYDALHTTGGACLVGDIDDYLKARGGDAHSFRGEKPRITDLIGYGKCLTCRKRD